MTGIKERKIKLIVKSYKELNKQLWGLVRGIRQCNFIPLEDREDIVQSSYVKIIEKINEGKLKDDYNEMKGYTFQVLRNFCLSYHREIEKKGTNYQIREDITPEEESNTEQRDYYRQILLNLVLSSEYTRKQRAYVQMSVSGYTSEEIKEELNLNNYQVGNIKRAVSQRMRNQIKKKPRYYIRKIDDMENKIPCYTYKDIKLWFSNMTFRQINYCIDNKKRIGDYYIVRA